MVFYRVFGLTFRAHRELPGLDQVPHPPAIDYSLKFDVAEDRFATLRAAPPCYVSPWQVKSGRAAVELRRTEDGRKFLLHCYDGIEFFIDRDDAEIWVGGWQPTSLEAATYHLLFSLPGFLLCLRNSTCLHGAAIAVGHGAIALLGKSRFGKSMLCAQLAAQGIGILSDDLVALDVIDGAAVVYPGYPWICLRSESLHWLRKHEFNASRAGSNWDYLDESYVKWDIRQEGFARSSRQLQAICLLAPEDGADCEPVIEQVPRHRAVMALMDASDRARIPYPEFRAQQFSLIGSVVAAVPVFELRYRMSIEGLRDLAWFLMQPRSARSMLGRQSQA